MLSTHPTLVDDSVSPRHIDLRPFAINDGEEVWVLPGGLTRVALGEGELVVTRRAVADRRTRGYSTTNRCRFESLASPWRNDTGA